MLNVNKITSMLSRLQPDSALQQYAAMHKNDPYIMALAVSEANRRKEAKIAAQGAQGQMEQPKVVDQELAEMAPAPVAPQMLPEDVGIARLPTGDMNYAGGGIVAFADGGDVERYQSSGLVQPQQRPGESFEDFRRRTFQESLIAEQARRQREYEAAEAARQRVLAERGGSAIPPSPYGIQRGPLVPSGVTPVPVATPAAATSTAPQPVRTPDPMTAAQPTTSTYTRTGGDPGPGRRPEAATTPRAEAGSAPAAGPARAAAPEMDIPAMISRELSAAEQKDNPFAAAVMQLGQDRVSAKEAEVKGLEDIQKKFADIYKGRRERLDTREGELGKMKSQQQGLALLQAGAAMMTTTGGIGRALGKGVQVGSEQYAAGLEKLQAAKDKITDARDRLEEIEAQRGELSARELNRARNEVKQAGISAREDLIKSNMQMYGVNRETAMKMVEMQVRVGTTQMEIASRERVAAATAAAAARNPQLETLRALQNDPKLLQTYQAMHGSKSNIMDEYTKFLKENPTLMGDEQKALAAFLRAKGVLGGGGAGAAAAGQGDGTVLPRKD